MKAADRNSMMVMGANAPALGGGVRSVATRPPRAGAPLARPDPASEVVAKPPRCRFTAEYRRRIVEDADRWADPGAGGRRFRREGRYRAPRSRWRTARRRGVLQGLTPRQRGAKPAQSPPPPPPASALVRRLAAKVARLEKDLAPARPMLAVQGQGAGRRGLRRNGANPC